MHIAGKDRQDPEKRSDAEDQSNPAINMVSGTTHRVATLGIPPNSNGELIGIQYSRACAALMVVIYHLHTQFERMGYTPPKLWSCLAYGVDIFFVISGLIMWVTTCDRTISPLAFLGRRFVRIVPLYWIVTTVTVILMLLAPAVLQTARFDLWHVAASYAFIAWRHPVTGTYEPVVIQGWTLNFEMFFYIVFSFLLLARRSIRLLLALAFFTLLALVGYIFADARHGLPGFYTSPIMLEFVFGMALGEIYVRTRLLDRIGGGLGGALALTGFALLIIAPALAPQLPHLLVNGVPALAIVTGVLALDAGGTIGRNRVLLLLGNASYSLYLTHPFVLSALSQVWRKLHLDHLFLGLCLFAALSVVASSVLAALSFRFVEVPLAAALKKRRQ